MTAADRKRLRAQFERHWPKCKIDGDSCGLGSESRMALAILDAADLLEEEAAQLEAWAVQSSAGGWSTHQVDPMMRRALVLRVRATRLEEALPEWTS